MSDVVVVVEWYEKGEDDCVGTQTLADVDPIDVVRVVGAESLEDLSAFRVEPKRATAFAAATGMKLDVSKYDYFVGLASR